MKLLLEEHLNQIRERLKASLKASSIDYDTLVSRLKEKKKVIIICGPTGVGKSMVGLNLAKILSTSIISVDSMQIYRGMDIGTDKYPVEMYGVKQYMIDVFNPDHYVTVVEFRDICRKIIEKEFFLKNRIPLLVGGSGLYIRGVIDNLKFIPESDSSVRRKLKEEIREYGLATYYEKLRKIDPIYSRKISSNDERRIIRALEVYEITGKPYSFFQDSWEDRKSIYDVIFLGFNIERSKLYRNIEERVDSMFKKGLVEEVENLVKEGYENCYSLRQAVGYKEVLRYLRGEISLAQCIYDVKRNTKKLAKKQITWFKQDKRIKWIRVDKYDNILELLEGILKIVWECLCEIKPRGVITRSNGSGSED